MDAPKCPHCKQEMQLNHEVVRNGEKIVVQYICGCRGEVTYHNWYAIKKAS
jgi:hypothetical protein